MFFYKKYTSLEPVFGDLTGTLFYNKVFYTNTLKKFFKKFIERKLNKYSFLEKIKYVKKKLMEQTL